MTVNRENMRLWIDALRSGEFEQGQGQLAYCELEYGKYGGMTEDRGFIRHCCLGVASEVAKRNEVPILVEELTQGTKITFQYNQERDFLPEAVQRWLGLSENNPELTVTLPDGSDACAPAAEFNDGEFELPGTPGTETLVLEDGQEMLVHAQTMRMRPLTFAEIADAIERTYLRQDDGQDH